MRLFTQSANYAPFDGEIYVFSGFYSCNEADTFYSLLFRTLAWQSEQLFIFGRRLKVPRLMAWYGDASAHYRYSGVEHIPLPWTADLQMLKADVETVCSHSFNSVLANLYRDGQDSMGSHADNEKELGNTPLIASLSLGESRLLRFRHPRSGCKLNIELAHGDLMVMAGALQQHWRHELPKTRKAKQPRINLTFRYIHSS